MATELLSGISQIMRGQVPVLELENRYGCAQISLLGGHVLSYQPKDEQGIKQADVLWCSEQALFDGHTPIRGGVPVCWPWFGPYNAEFNAPVEGEQLPNHGFARKMLWTLSHSEILDQGAILVELTLQDCEQTRAIWDYAFTLTLRVTLDESLHIALITHNQNSHALKITEALHSYFSVGHAAQVEIDGLSGAQCIDTLQGVSTRAPARVSVTPPIDNVYLNVGAQLQLKPASQGRDICLTASDAHSAVLWNPGAQIVKGFKDIADSDWPQFVCLETGNVWHNAVSIPANGTHQMAVSLKAL